MLMIATWRWRAALQIPGSNATALTTMPLTPLHVKGVFKVDARMRIATVSALKQSS